MAVGIAGEANRRRRPAAGSVVFAVCPDDGCASPTVCDSTPQAFRERYGSSNLPPEQAVLRRSIAMFPPQAPSGLSPELALAIPGQLVRVLRELRRR